VDEDGQLIAAMASAPVLTEVVDPDGLHGASSDDDAEPDYWAG